jgi:hypothetical protein
MDKFRELQKNILEKDLLMQKIDRFRPKFNAYISLISAVFMNVDLWKNRDVIRLYKYSRLSEEKEKITNLRNDNEFLRLYDAFSFMNINYENMVVTETLHQMPTTSVEIEKYKDYTNCIWHSITCRNDIKRDINVDGFNQLSDYEEGRITECLSNLDEKYKSKTISIELIAQISGEVEEEVMAPISKLIEKYEALKKVDLHIGAGDGNCFR